MDRWEYRTFRFTVEAAEDLASYDQFGAEGSELVALAPMTSPNFLTRMFGTDWALAVFKRRIARVDANP